MSTPSEPFSTSPVFFEIICTGSSPAPDRRPCGPVASIPFHSEVGRGSRSPSRSADRPNPRRDHRPAAPCRSRRDVAFADGGRPNGHIARREGRQRLRLGLLDVAARGIRHREVGLVDHPRTPAGPTGMFPAVLPDDLVEGVAELLEGCALFQRLLDLGSEIPDERVGGRACDREALRVGATEDVGPARRCQIDLLAQEVDRLVEGQIKNAVVVENSLKDRLRGRASQKPADGLRLPGPQWAGDFFETEIEACEGPWRPYRGTRPSLHVAPPPDRPPASSRSAARPAM